MKTKQFCKPLEIPLNGCLMAVERKNNDCKGCYFSRKATGDCWNIHHGFTDAPRPLPCNAGERGDKRDVIFKLVKEFKQ
jgi:hypothetical protein